MTRHDDRKALPYTPQQMFDLVADIQSYPEFLPWCKGARIRRTDTEGDVTTLEADLIIAFAAFREKFGSHVVMDNEAHKISVDYLDGPFRTLKNEWIFMEHPEGCEVKFYVEFEFKSRVLQLAIGQVFEHAMMRIVRAFEERAKALYG